MSADLSWDTYRDATFSRRTREWLNVIEQFMVAVLDEPDILPQYLIDDREEALLLLREVMRKWDENEATEIVL